MGEVEARGREGLLCQGDVLLVVPCLWNVCHHTEEGGGGRAR